MTHTSGHNSLVLLGVATVFCAAHTPLSALGLVRELLEADPTWHASEASLVHRVACAPQWMSLILAATTAQPRVLAPLSHRIGWMHMPKTGTSFGLSLARLANASLPRDATLRNDKGRFAGKRMTQGRDFISRFPHQKWFQGIFWGNFAAHTTLSQRSGWSPNYVGRIFVMIREPSSRARSAYNHFGHHCHSNFSSFEARMRGTAVTMITGQRENGLDCMICPKTPKAAKRRSCPPLTPNASLAVQRLGTFAFVGLVEEWALSVCLLHTMHGPTFHSERCEAAEFYNSRKGNYNKTSDENISALSANDPADEALYAAAKSRFWSDVRRYAVTPASCRARGCSTD